MSKALMLTDEGAGSVSKRRPRLGLNRIVSFPQKPIDILMRILLAIVLIFTFSEFAFCQVKKTAIGFYAEVMRRDNTLISQNPNLYLKAEGKNKFGYGLGVNIYFFPSSFVAFRFSPGAALEFDQLVFRYIYLPISPNDPIVNGREEFKFSTLQLKLPAHAMVAINPTQTLFLVGGFTSYYAGKEFGNRYYHLNRFDLSADFGLAYSLKIGSVQVRPELKYALNLVNGKANTKHSNEWPLSDMDKYYRNRIVLTFFFLKPKNNL